MVRDAIIAFIQISLLCWKPYDSAVLPKWVYRVHSCPNPNNLSQWIEASKRFNCYHNLTSTKPNEQAKVYHCIPSSFFNETVEFCGRNVPVSPGNCPVYNYEVVQNTRPTYHNCTDFISGCPTAVFDSKEVYKHPACLKLNTLIRCFEKDEKCTYKSTTHGSTSTQGVITMWILTTLTTSPSKDIDADFPYSVDIVAKLNRRYGLERNILIGILSAVVIVVFICWILCKRKYILYKCMKNDRPATTSDIQMSFSSKNHRKIKDTYLSKLKQDQNNLYEKLKTKEDAINDMENGQPDTDSERSALLSKMWRVAKKCPYKDFLQTLTEEITPDMVNSIKYRLKDREENEYDALDSIHEPDELLKYLEKEYNAFYNLPFLQGLFLSCKIPKLYDQCVDYAKSRGGDILFCEKTILKSDHTKVIYIINCPNVDEYKWQELDKLRNILESFTGAQYDDIIVAGVKSGCVIVTFMIRNCLIPKLRRLYTSERESMTCQWVLKLPLKYKIMKVMIQDDVIYMSDAFLSVDKLTAEAKLSGEALKTCLKSVQEKKKICLSLDKVHLDVECNDNLKINLEKMDKMKDIMSDNEAQQIAELSNERDKLGAYITTVNDEVRQLRAALELKEAEKNAANEKSNKLERKLDRLTIDNEKLTEERDKCEQKSFEYRDECSSLRENLEKSQAECLDLLSQTQEGSSDGTTSLLQGNFNLTSTPMGNEQITKRHASLQGYGLLCDHIQEYYKAFQETQMKLQREKEKSRHINELLSKTGYRLDSMASELNNYRTMTEGYRRSLEEEKEKSNKLERKLDRLTIDNEKLTEERDKCEQKSFEYRGECSSLRKNLEKSQAECLDLLSQTQEGASDGTTSLLQGFGNSSSQSNSVFGIRRDKMNWEKVKQRLRSSDSSLKKNQATCASCGFTIFSTPGGKEFLT